MIVPRGSLFPDRPQLTRIDEASSQSSVFESALGLGPAELPRRHRNASANVEHDAECWQLAHLDEENEYGPEG